MYFFHRYRTAAGRLMRRKKVRRQAVVQHASLPPEVDCLAALQWVLSCALGNLARAHGYPHAPWANVATRLWAAYVAALRQRLPFPLLQLSVNEPRAHLPPRQPAPAASRAKDDSRATASGCSEIVVENACIIVGDPDGSVETSVGDGDGLPVGEAQRRLARRRATRQALASAAAAGDNGSAQEPPVVPLTMGLVLGLLLCSARVARLPLLAADLGRACR